MINFGELDEELNQARAHPFKVVLEFERRFRVWQDIIHRNRKLHLIAAPSRKEFMSLKRRYTELDKLDAGRLSRRAHKEFLFVISSDYQNSSLIIKHRQVLLYRLEIIRLELEWQLSRYDEIEKSKLIPHSYMYEQIVFYLDGG